MMLGALSATTHFTCRCSRPSRWALLAWHWSGDCTLRALSLSDSCSDAQAPDGDFFLLLLFQRGSGNWHSLFLHVPQFSAIQPNCQLQFAQDLLRLLHHGTADSGGTQNNNIRASDSVSHRHQNGDQHRVFMHTPASTDKSGRAQQALSAVSAHKLQTASLLLLGLLWLKAGSADKQ